MKCVGLGVVGVHSLGFGVFGVQSLGFDIQLCEESTFRVVSAAVFSLGLAIYIRSRAIRGAQQRAIVLTTLIPICPLGRAS